MEPSQQEIDHMMELIKEFRQVMKDLMSGSAARKPDVVIKETTSRVKEIGAEIKALKEKYPKFRRLNNV